MRRQNNHHPKRDGEIVFEVGDIDETVDEDHGDDGERVEAAVADPGDENPSEREDAEETGFAPEIQKDVVRVLEDLHPCGFVIRLDGVWKITEACTLDRTIE